ncbi:purine-nucleoside phosphorylase [Acidipropionibacterium timonense]|uniref:purine-nucleoside phosphorylase n=1 Tax=Acidipropionibacterium timonense TaxID=2161818 RepID=UPI00102FCB56|nr:purine-nucleoside phosphorylase [Acidipropionibacterium timonense]
MATPHNAAEPGDIAPLVLMPGDPRRAARIARDFLTDARVVSEVRGIGTWTGTWQGTPMSVMASGMGIPSLSIYATELYRFYGVRRICRVGTCGGMSPDVDVRDVVIASSAHTNDGCSTLPVPGVTLSMAASFDMLRAAVDAARASGATTHVGAVFSSDTFYTTRPEVTQGLIAMGTLGVEMEAAGLYGCAMAERAEALAVLTVSDHLTKAGSDMSAEERETSFESALEIAARALVA